MIPSFRATALAVVRLSPVSMMTLTPSAASAFSASGVDALTGSAIANSPASFPSTAMLMTVAPSPRRRFACSLNELGFDAERCQEVRIAKEDGLAVDLAGCALAGRRVERLHLAQIEIALLGGPHDRIGERMFAGALHAGREPQNLGLLKSGGGNDRDNLRLALGQRSRLVDHQRVDLFHALQRFGILDQHAGLRAAPDADHDRHRCGKAERAGTGDDQHADGRNQAERHPGFRPEPGPGAKSDDRNDDHRRHEPAGDLIGQPLDRRTRTLRLRDHLDDL